MTEQSPTIIFDVDGVLVQTVPLHFRAWQAAFAAASIPFDEQDYQRVNGLPREVGVRRIVGPQADQVLVDSIAQHKQKIFLATISQSPPRPLPGIPALLAKLQQEQWHIGAASSSRNAAAVLAAASLTPYFLTIVTGSDFSRPKPDPDIFLTTARRLAARPKRTIVVEDAAQGVTAASAAGFAAVGIATTDTPAMLRAAGATVVVNSTRALTTALLHKLLK